MSEAAQIVPGTELEAALSAGQRAVALLLRFWIVGILLLLVAYFSIDTPNHAFFQLSNFKNVGFDTSKTILLAVGETFVIVTAGIDLSVGGILVLSGVCAGLTIEHLSGTKAQTDALIFPHADRAIPIGIAVGLAVGLLCGVVNGLLVTALRLPSFIVTLGTLGITFGLADILSGGANITSVPSQLQDTLGNGQVFGIYVPTLIALGVVVVAALGLHMTRFGRYTSAYGSNPEGTRRAGIRVNRHLVKVYGLSGLLCGLAGVLDLARFGTLNLSGHNTDNLDAIAAVVIGGTSLFGGVGTILGTLIGAFIPNVLYNGFVIQGRDPFYQEVFVGVVIILAVYVDQLRRRRWSS